MADDTAPPAAQAAAVANAPALKALNALKAACVFIKSPDGSTGSGYLVAPGFIGTAAHVVRKWVEGQSYEVLVGLGPTRQTCKAHLHKRDEVADAAVLAVEGSLAAPPLPVAGPLTSRAAWEGYGFPALANKTDTPAGLSITGHVQDPDTFNDNNQPAVLLYSDAIAAGQASPLHGFSGSPVVVEGALIGHLVKHIGEIDDRRRAAYGYAYACPISAVTALLPALPAAQPIAPPAITTVRESVPALATDDYHVFVSYRSSDRPFAMSLVTRLEGAGLKVFIDQKELEPGQYLGSQLEAAMKRSKSAVVLVSAGWLGSPWCQQEAQVLLNRALKDPTFTLVPLRLDGSTMPDLLDTRLWLDFNGSAQAEGPELDKLVRTLLHRALGATVSPAEQAAAAQARVTDEFVARLRTAALGLASDVDAVLAQWQKTRSDDTAPLIAAAEAYNGKAQFERTLAALAGAPPSLRVRQLTAFAKRKSGRANEALQELEALKREGHLDAETAGLLAGTYKARWLESGDLAFRGLAYETYREAYERSGDPFPGINAAAMALHCSDEGKMHEFAAQVIAALLKKPAEQLTHWDKASLGEAYLLKKRMDDARDWYAKAVAAAAGLHQDVAVMRKQARLDLVALGRPRDELDTTLPVPRVLAYAGHRIDAPGRAQPRFPQAKVAAVRQAIRDKLQGLGPLHGFGGAASGADLLVLQELAGRSLTATVVLPFPADDFAEVSVGEGLWRTAFEDLRRTRGIEFLDPPLQAAKPPPEALPRAFYDANREVQRRAVEYAKRLSEDAVLLVVWDGQAGDGLGGTADTVALWDFQGVKPITINPLAL